MVMRRVLTSPGSHIVALLRTFQRFLMSQTPPFWDADSAFAQQRFVAVRSPPVLWIRTVRA